MSTAPDWYQSVEDRHTSLSLVPGPSPALAMVTKARAMLAEARTVQEVKDVRDKAQAIRDYAKQSGECLEVQNAAAEIKLRAERRAGELLEDMSELGPGKCSTLEHLGIDRKESHRWQRTAAIPEIDFDRHIEETKSAGKELTSAAVYRLGAQFVEKPDPSPERERNVHDAVIDLLDCLRDHYARWPEESRRVMAIKLIDFGQELMDTGELRA